MPSARFGGGQVLLRSRRRHSSLVLLRRLSFYTSPSLLYFNPGLRFRPSPPVGTHTPSTELPLPSRVAPAIPHSSFAMLPSFRPLALALLLTTLATTTFAQEEPVPQRVRAERAHQELLRAQQQQQLGVVAVPGQELSFNVAGAQDGLAPVVGWTGTQPDELDAPSWDLIESEADAAEDDAMASTVEQEEERIQRAAWGRRAHLKKRSTPRVKREFELRRFPLSPPPPFSSLVVSL